MSLYLLLFAAGVLTILLPCILPLLPIVVGVSVAGRSPLRPLWLAIGMVIGFVGITFLLYVVLSQFVTLANIIHIATFYVLLLFGLGFVSEKQSVQFVGAILGALFFIPVGWVTVLCAAILGCIAMGVGGVIASKIQQAGVQAQGAARSSFGSQSVLTDIVLGLTMGLVWVPCAGPALAFALTLVREQPGLQAFIALTCYAIGAALPVLLIGYGGQFFVQRMRSLNQYSGTAKHVGGVVLIATAILLNFNLLQNIQVWLVSNTAYGTFGTNLEQRFFPMPNSPLSGSGSSSSADSMHLPTLPVLVRAPEFTGLSTWHNSQPLTMVGLKGKVVLVDFWTYSCINCIRTLPYIEQYQKKFGNENFTVIGIHTPEFVFEKDDANVEMAIKKYGLTYPVAQDNDYGTWNAFANRYWPAKYLIDAQGRIRYTHFGEGGYDETDLAIQSLLAEIGEKVDGSAVSVTQTRPQGPVSAETYLHSRSWPAFGNSQDDPSDAVLTYTAPTTLKQNYFYLDGTWQLVDDEYQRLDSDEGHVRMKWVGGEINLVMGLDDGASPVTADVLMDGKKVKTITISNHDLYNLFKGAYGVHELDLQIHGKGVQAYAFTFGS